MPNRLYRHLQVSCVGFIGVAVGLLVGSHLVKVPGVLRPPPRPGSAEAALNKVVPEIDLEGTPFNRAVERVRKLSPVPIAVNWKKLRAAGIDTGAPVVWRARDVTLDRILREMTRAVQTPQAYVGYAAVGDLILISTSDDVTRLSVVVRSYDVRDLLRPPADPWDDGKIPNPTIADWPAPPAQPPPLEDGLKELIEELVAPETWRDNGGLTGSIRVVAGRMFVVQSSENQRQIARILADLRDTTTGPVSAPPPAPDLRLWDDTLKKYISADPAVGEAALERRLPDVRFDRVPLDRAVTTLGDMARADLIVDWGAFERAKLNYRTPVSVHLHDVTLAKALREVMNAAGAGRLDIRLSGGVVTLGLLQADDLEIVVRVYDLRDWLASVMGPPPAPAPKSPADLTKWNRLKDAHIDELIKVVQANAAPDSWKETGGTVGAIRELNRQLIVTQTRENQERVADLLAALRIGNSRARGWEPSPAVGLRAATQGSR